VPKPRDRTFREETGEEAVSRERDNDEQWEPVSFDDVVCLSQTKMAIKVLVDGEEYWIPKSQVNEDSEVYQKGDEGKLIVPRWLAEEKEMV
jgi:hypothetical protein